MSANPDLYRYRYQHALAQKRRSQRTSWQTVMCLYKQNGRTQVCLHTCNLWLWQWTRATIKHLAHVTFCFQVNIVAVSIRRSKPSKVPSKNERTRICVCVSSVSHQMSQLSNMQIFPTSKSRRSVEIRHNRLQRTLLWFLHWFGKLESFNTCKHWMRSRNMFSSTCGKTISCFGITITHQHNDIGCF